MFSGNNEMICDIHAEGDQAVDVIVPTIGYDEYRRQFITEIKCLVIQQLQRLQAPKNHFDTRSNKSLQSTQSNSVDVCVHESHKALVVQ
uniref:Uncharacterized protein n=1 Tax=Glossina austeni TaxID=7395 RepID=A0A1A9V992_GLOAU